MFGKNDDFDFLNIFSNNSGSSSDNSSGSFLDTLFAPTPKPVKKIKTVDIYDWDNPDNCSDREYMDDDDYDDFDS